MFNQILEWGKLNPDGSFITEETKLKNEGIDMNGMDTISLGNGKVLIPDIEMLCDAF